MLSAPFNENDIMPIYILERWHTKCIFGTDSDETTFVYKLK